MGCPIAHRAWILPRWFDHVEAACSLAGLEPTYVFVADSDDPCVTIARKRARRLVMVHSPSPTKGDDTRRWDPERYAEMVRLRNLLLQAVRLGEPDVFLSLDSDILLHPWALDSMLESLERFDAVGGKCFMTKTATNVPSWARLGREGQLQRMDADGVFDVDVIMAVKLMSPVAYLVDYVTDVQGEDTGWSKACRAAGVKLGWDGRVTSKHVMEPWMLDRVDERVGF